MPVGYIVENLPYPWKPSEMLVGMRTNLLLLLALVGLALGAACGQEAHETPGPAGAAGPRVEPVALTLPPAPPAQSPVDAAVDLPAPVPEAVEAGAEEGPASPVVVEQFPDVPAGPGPKDPMARYLDWASSPMARDFPEDNANVKGGTIPDGKPPDGKPPDGKAPPGSSPATGNAGRDSSDLGRAYTWQDGERTRTVYIVTGTDSGAPPGGNAGRERDDAGSGRDTVFQSAVGERMTLPGGTLLALDAEWDQARINVFFSKNGIKKATATKHSFARNGYFIETAPGLASLELANRLAGLDGVTLAVPNWKREIVAK